jgi:hypothetical protein
MKLDDLKIGYQETTVQEKIVCQKSTVVENSGLDDTLMDLGDSFYDMVSAKSFQDLENFQSIQDPAE